MLRREGTTREIVQTIVEHGGDVNVRGRCGKTPLHVAAGAGHLVTIRLFSLLHSRK
jgi:ankyrin repeat protein